MKQSQFQFQLATLPGVCNCPLLKQHARVLVIVLVGSVFLEGSFGMHPERHCLGASQFPAAVMGNVAIPGAGLDTKAVRLPHKGRVAMCPALHEMLTAPPVL